MLADPTPGHAGGIEHEGGCQAGGELGNAPERVGIGERACELGVDNHVELPRLVPAGVADGPLAFGVSPAGAVGDQLAVFADEKSADDLGQGRVQPAKQRRRRGLREGVVIIAFIALYRVLAFIVWFGVMFALCTVVIAVALAAVLLAVVYGLASPSRTPASCLRSLALNARQLIVEVDALRPS